jgi:hypothetical protein
VRIGPFVRVGPQEFLSRPVNKVTHRFLLLNTFSFSLTSDTFPSNVLEKNLRSLIDNVDELCMETNKFLNYHKQLQKQNHLKQQHIQKRVSLKFLVVKTNIEEKRLFQQRKQKIRLDWLAVKPH